MFEGDACFLWLVEGNTGEEANKGDYHLSLNFLSFVIILLVNLILFIYTF